MAIQVTKVGTTAELKGLDGTLKGVKGAAFRVDDTPNGPRATVVVMVDDDTELNNGAIKVKAEIALDSTLEAVQPEGNYVVDYEVSCYEPGDPQIPTCSKINNQYIQDLMSKPEQATGIVKWFRNLEVIEKARTDNLKAAITELARNSEERATLERIVAGKKEDDLKRIRVVQSIAKSIDNVSAPSAKIKAVPDYDEWYISTRANTKFGSGKKELRNLSNATDIRAVLKASFEQWVLQIAAPVSPFILEGSSIEIQGFTNTDKRLKNDEFNRQLSKDRAEAIRTLLIQVAEAYAASLSGEMKKRAEQVLAYLRQEGKIQVSGVGEQREGLEPPADLKDRGVIIKMRLAPKSQAPATAPTPAAAPAAPAAPATPGVPADLEPKTAPLTKPAAPAAPPPSTGELPPEVREILRGGNP